MTTTHVSYAARRREAGLAFVIVAIFAVVLLGFVGLALDGSHVQSAAHQLQDAADAAALAAAAKLASESSPSGGSYDTTRTAAVDVAALNEAVGLPVKLDPNTGNSAGGDVVVGTWNTASSVFTPTTTSPNAVKVVARRTTGTADGPLPLYFGGALGFASGEVARTAIASFVVSPNPFVLVLDPAGDGALTMSGNGSLGVSGGKVQVNSTSSTGIKMSGNAVISADVAAVCGNASLSGNASISNLEAGASAYADPLESLLPTSTAWNTVKNSMPKPLGANGKIGGTGTFAPGYYPKGLSLSGPSIATLQPGLYMFGDSFSMSGQSTLIGTAVTFLVDSGIQPSLSGGAGMTITPPSSGTYKGLAMMCHRSTTGSSVLKLSGNGLIQCQGTFYVPGGGASLSGNGAAQALGQLICWSLTMSGNGACTGLNIVPSTTGSQTTLVK